MFSNVWQKPTDPPVREFIPGARAWESCTVSIDTRVTFNKTVTNAEGLEWIWLLRKKENCISQTKPSIYQNETNKFYSISIRKNLGIFNHTNYFKSQ